MGCCTSAAHAVLPNAGSAMAASKSGGNPPHGNAKELSGTQALISRGNDSPIPANPKIASSTSENVSSPSRKVRRASFAAREVSENVQHDGVDAILPPRLVGFHSNHGRKPSSTDDTYVEAINQDRGLICYPLANNNECMLLAAFDGHGQRGELISEFAAFAVLDALEEEPAELSLDPELALRRATQAADSRLRNEMPRTAQYNGTTAILTLLTKTRATTACIGDSRAVMGREADGGWHARDLSDDQKVDSPDEMLRIQNAGGRIHIDKDIDVARVIHRCKGLSMARSLGDFLFDEVGVISDPVVTSCELTPADKCIIVASDGVWEFMSSQAAVNICMRHKNNASEACKALIRESARLWEEEEGQYRDDITAIVVFLPVIEHLPKRLSTDEKAQTNVTAFDADTERVMRGSRQSAVPLDDMSEPPPPKTIPRTTERVSHVPVDGVINGRAVPLSPQSLSLRRSSRRSSDASQESSRGSTFARRLSVSNPTEEELE